MASLLKLELSLDGVPSEDVDRMLLLKLLINQGKMMATLAELQAALTVLSNKVAAETDVVQSVETLLTGLTQLIKDLRTQLAAVPGVPQAAMDQVAALATAVDGMTAGLSAAVTVNTPATP